MDALTAKDNGAFITSPTSAFLMVELDAGLTQLSLRPVKKLPAGQAHTPCKAHTPCEADATLWEALRLLVPMGNRCLILFCPAPALVVSALVSGV